MIPRSPEELAFLLAHPDVFVLEYFPHAITKLKEFHTELLGIVTTEPRSLCLLPATHGKSTLISTILPIYEVCCDPNVRVAVIGKNDKDAHNIMRAIQAELTANEALIRDFGPFIDEGKPWSLQRLDVAGRTRFSKSGTIVCFGAGSRDALGYRADVVVCDDVVTDKNSSTAGQRETLSDWFSQGPETMGEEEGNRLIVVGTLFDANDLYSELRRLVDPETGEPAYFTYHKDAIVDEAKKQSLWPERWPWPRLMRTKAKTGTINFNKRFRNIAINKEGMTFREEYVKGGFIGEREYPGCLDEGYSYGDFDPSWRLAQGFDPAVGVSKKAKFCAHITLAEGSCDKHERCFWVVDLVHGQFRLREQVNLILDQFEAYTPSVSKVEANSFQGGLAQEVQDRMDDLGRQYAIEAHYTDRRNKPDPELGVEAMSPWFENGKVHIPWADPGSMRRMEPLVDELIMYPALTTDTVMAFWFAWRPLEKRSRTLPTFNRLARSRDPFLRRMAGRRKSRNPLYPESEESVG